ncbi:hypothetical protein F5Y00DRAFT_271920 [Daldinia vernicosa]|uniref:uncharacterized protein n=1 Tax=Daldinia vernicosa TaxID=114800 RepID=UPI002008718C|nr:uncharacterized protein F5Y00DRAFT_271920 [Daldinia vernicosa]KAI0846643.1 hypothetical protein F5Y00DRAFT_271920 [Daldinia vernicosa]
MADKPRTRTRDEYTVGWICALPKEQVAAIAMLDDEHPDIPKLPNDYNTYTLGSIGGYNVAITCLPKGTVGTNSAATAAAQMVNTFPCIKIGLMVGIGGGIPSKVRLGDVVVSVPTDEHPGVVQWDFGKAEEGGKFRRTGALNRPPRALLTAVSTMESKVEMLGSRIPQYLEDMKTKFPNLHPKYTQSSQLKDPLVSSDTSSDSYRTWHVIFSMIYHMILAFLGYHLGRGTFDTTNDGTMQARNNASIVADIDQGQKSPTDVHVHYGLIASGNSVIKDAAFRDSIDERLGGNVLCVEMEAAGLINDFPCIVIRGICDYADSRKSKDWQEYAASIAAGCAKELLQYVQQADVDREVPMKDILPKILETVSKIGSNVQHLKSRLDRDEDMAIVNWLASNNSGRQYSDFISRRQPETGKWFLDSTEYQKWLSAPNQTLFCPGIPGSGKTILASIVIENILEKAAKTDNIGVAYVYFNFRRTGEQSLNNILRGLLRQLVQSQSSLHPEVKSLYDREQGNGTSPSLEDISAAIRSVSLLYSQVFIVIDALDECQTGDGYLSLFLARMFSLQVDTGLNLFITSRYDPEIQGYFTGCISREIIANEEDVRKYINGNIYKLPRFISKSPGLLEEIERDIISAVKGMFLLAQLYVDSLMDKISVADIKNALKNLKMRARQEGGEVESRGVINKAYDEAMQRIDGQMEGHRILGRKVLLWIASAKRPLKITELQHALAVKASNTELDRDNIIEIELIVSEYFEGRRGELFSNEKNHVATTCLTYLSFDVFASGPCSPFDYRERLESNPFYDYAANNWGWHIDEEASVNEQEILRFLGDDAKASASAQAIIKSDYNYISDISTPLHEWTKPDGVSGLHLAAWFGLKNVVLILLKNGHNPMAEDALKRTPLQWAAVRGHQPVVDQLLETGSIKPDPPVRVRWNREERSDADSLGPKSKVTLSQGLGEVWNLDINKRLSGIKVRRPQGLSIRNPNTT